MALSSRELLQVAAFSALPVNRSRTRPNIILLVGDDHRCDALGYTGTTVALSPNLAGRSHQAVVSAYRFPTTPICCTSRASLMYLEYAALHSVYHFETSFFF